MSGKIKNLIGQRFGKLEVIEFAGMDKHGKAMWRCRCDCGSDIIVLGNNLQSGATVSCGCSRLGMNAKVKFTGDEMKIAMKHLLDKGLKQHPFISEFWATPEGQIYIIRENHIIQPSYTIGKSGYYQFGAAINGEKVKKYSVHRIIAETFLVNDIGPDAVVNHLNEQKLCNDVSNLEWCTQAFNTNWSIAKSVRAFNTETNEWIGDFLNIREAAKYFRCSEAIIGKYMKCVKRNVRFEFIDNYLKSAQKAYLKENERKDLRFSDIDKTIAEF